MRPKYRAPNYLAPVLSIEVEGPYPNLIEHMKIRTDTREGGQ